MKTGILLFMQTGKNLQESEETTPPRQLTKESLPPLSPLILRWLETEIRTPAGEVDARLELAYNDSAFTFLAEYKSDWTERSFQQAITQIKRASQASKGKYGYPLVILPYLSEEKLKALAEQSISGFDLCGNANITVPGRWLIYITGLPNRFRLEKPLRNPYKGKASLVGRTLLRQPVFSKLEELHREIERRGGDISLALVSRAVQCLEQEVVTDSHAGNKVVLVQADKLLDRLAQAYPMPKPTVLWKGKVDKPTVEFLPLLFQARSDYTQPVILTGNSSASHYVNLTSEDVVRIYAREAKPLIAHLPATRTERFANLEILAPPDSLVFFDPDVDEAGVAWASPVQTYLEMMQSGDIRLQQSASALREQLVDAVNREMRKGQKEATR
jgi:hypothetical protein